MIFLQIFLSTLAGGFAAGHLEGDEDEMKRVLSVYESNKKWC